MRFLSCKKVMKKIKGKKRKNTTKKKRKNKKRRSKTERCRRTKKGKNRVNARRPKNLLRDARGEKNNVFGKSQNGLREGPREKNIGNFPVFDYGPVRALKTSGPASLNR